MASHEKGVSSLRRRLGLSKITQWRCGFCGGLQTVAFAVAKRKVMGLFGYPAKTAKRQLTLAFAARA